MGPYGVIYIINNRIHGENIFKIGRTNNLNQRLKELNGHTSNLGQFEPVAFFPVSDTVTAEADVHRSLQEVRIQDNREFFRGNKSEIISIVENVASKYYPEIFTSNEKQERQQGVPNYNNPKSVTASWYMSFMSLLS
jgi:hypothetical protein